ncbi:MAG: hypothetical protein LBM77_03990 [Spirochaetaceae bacterium]|jgi:hypothetical protein|nr:hypothetical protein [Spirochaetaceae bacterium]
MSPNIIKAISEYSNGLGFDSAHVSLWFGSGSDNIVKALQDNNESDSFRVIMQKYQIDNTNKQYGDYQEIYVKANNVVNSLIVKDEKEFGVAHYTTIDIASKMLFDHSEIRQFSIKKVNDPSEGKTLLCYLQDDNSPINLNNLDCTYQAFVTCFTFNHNHLNQFRLYGKANHTERKYDKISKKDKIYVYQKECAGLSLLFNGNFFSKQEVLIAPDIISNTKNVNDTKPTLYRCLYIDPDTKQIVSVGQRDKYTFYRKSKYSEDTIKSDSEYNKYQNSINDVMKHVETEMSSLAKAVNEMSNKDDRIIADLLINLRYLVKHYAFKEEQECRIIQVKNISDVSHYAKDGIKKEKNKLYLEAGDIGNHVDRIFFAPCADEKMINLFLYKLKYSELNINHYISNLPFENVSLRQTRRRRSRRRTR